MSQPDEQTLSVVLRDPKTNVRSGSIILLANEPLAPRTYTSAVVKNVSASVEATDGRIFAAAGGIGSVKLTLTAVGGAGTADTHGTVEATTVVGGPDGGVSEARLSVSF